MNPYTDEYLAKAKTTRARHANCPRSGCSVETLENGWIAELQATLPDVAPNVIGQVLLHIGTLLPKLTDDQVLFAIMPDAISPYLRDTLSDLGADLLTPRKGSANDTPAASS